jgi:hypothetical protein
LNHRVGKPATYAQGYFESGLRVYSFGEKGYLKDKERKFNNTAYKDKKNAFPTFMPSVTEEKTIKQSIHERTLEKREKKREFRGTIPELRYSAL